MFPGGGDVEDTELRRRFEAAWLPRWGDKATTSNGFVPVRHLPSGRGVGAGALVAAITSGQIRAMYIENTIGGRYEHVNPELAAVLPQLEYLVVADSYDSPLARQAQAVLPLAMSMEKDGTFTSFDRTIQRLRAAVPAMGDALSGTEILSRLARRLGYGLEARHPSKIMAEIAATVPGYTGVSYARLERNGINLPSTSFSDAGTPILSTVAESGFGLRPTLVPATANSR
jgi:predicted molibdopterin-dependent oxidoreductase YjgC